MSPLKFIIFAVLVGAGYYHWRDTRNLPATPTEEVPLLMQGFVESPLFAGEGKQVVMLFTTADISEVAYRRVTDLAKELQLQGIPVVTAPPLSTADISRNGLAAGRIAAIKAGEQPLVVIRGRIKSNPLPAAVILEYGK